MGASTSKEIHYFDRHYNRGVAWYLGHFPTRLQAARLSQRVGRDVALGEASPYYLFHPLVPERVAAVLPDCRFIVLLRDPVERAISHYFHEVDLGVETLPLGDALEAERSRLEGEAERLRAEPTYVSFSHRHYSYVSRGLYADQLRRWFAAFPRNQFLILDSADLFRDPELTYRRVLTFLGLGADAMPSFAVHNATNHHDADVGVVDRLVSRFSGPNDELYELIGTRYDWLADPNQRS